jgi:hypothetical protein
MVLEGRRLAPHDVPIPLAGIGDREHGAGKIRDHGVASHARGRDYRVWNVACCPVYIDMVIGQAPPFLGKGERRNWMGLTVRLLIQ